MWDESLTDRQKQIFEFIRDLIQKRGYGPTVREIARRFGIKSPNGVMGHLRALESKGVIIRAANKSRAIELSPNYLGETSGLPLAGVVSAGAMLEAVEQGEYRVEFDDLLKRRGAYVLEVRGDSMIDAHICHGDWVIVQPRRTANKGDIVVVQNDDGEATIKYWFPERGRIRLQPANRRMRPIYSRDAKVIGVVVGLVRDIK